MTDTAILPAVDDGANKPQASDSQTDERGPADDTATEAAAIVLAREERTVRFGDLGIARENLRHGEPPDEDIPLLSATLKAAGQLKRLTVRPGRGRKEKAWMALDGRRRCLALGLLKEAGDIDDDYPVRVTVETDPARQAAAALLTNTAVPVHVADVIAAIGRMLKSRLSLAVIARALGYSEVEIRRLAALAGLPTAALVALKSGRMTLRQARLLARLKDRDEQTEMAEAVLAGHGFQDWRVQDKLDEGRVTTRDRRCALVDPQTYAEAGGRTETDLFGELPPVLLDPDILTTLWMRRVESIAAHFRGEGLTVHVTAGPEPDLPEGLEALGYVYGRALPAEEMARYRQERDQYAECAEAVRTALAEASPAYFSDLAMIDMIQARIVWDQTGCGGRAVTTLWLWPASGTGLDVRCYTPLETETSEAAYDTGPELAGPAATPAYVAPVIEAPEPDVEGVTHALHAVRTDAATRGLIRALADDPGVALTALIARLFTVLVLRIQVARSDAALSIGATAYDPAGAQVIETLDGEVRSRLDQRRAAWQASGETVIGWVHSLPHGEKMGLLAELTAISLDLREARTNLIRHRARADAFELAALCQPDITEHWTPDVGFLRSHSKPLLLGMLQTMGAGDDRVAGLKKTELVDWVAEQAAARRWAPDWLSWRRPIASGEVPETATEADPVETPGDAEGTGDFVITAAGLAALEQTAA
ncbi:ParB/RepB/Spo0J family partition protein [Brevundimonas sp.]